MFNFLHTHLPQPILFSFGPINIHWYGLCLVLAMFAAIGTTIYIGRYYRFTKETILDVSFWVIIGGLIGARVYEVFLESSYYFNQPLAIFRVWEGGLAIHGGIIGGLFALVIFARVKHLDPLALAASIVPGLALGQAIGRWGNWFNQELFGLPTTLPWGIPINFLNRPIEYSNSLYFHPTFLYESLGCLVIFLGLLMLGRFLHLKSERRRSILMICTYLAAYAILRYLLEEIKIDKTPLFLSLRWPQVMSIIMFIFSSCWLLITFKRKSL